MGSGSPFFDGKVTFLAKPSLLQVNTWLAQPCHYQLSQGERIRACTSAVFSSGKRVNCFSNKHLLKLTRAGRVTQWKFFLYINRASFACFLDIGSINKTITLHACVTRFLYVYSSSLRYMQDISTRRQNYFSLFTLWCQCFLKIHIHRKITYIWPT